LAPRAAMLTPPPFLSFVFHFPLPVVKISNRLLFRRGFKEIDVPFSRSRPDPFSDFSVVKTEVVNRLQFLSLSCVRGGYRSFSRLLLLLFLQRQGQSRPFVSSVRKVSRDLFPSFPFDLATRRHDAASFILPRGIPSFSPPPNRSFMLSRLFFFLIYLSVYY